MYVLHLSEMGRSGFYTMEEESEPFPNRNKKGPQTSVSSVSRHTHGILKFKYFMRPTAGEDGCRRLSSLPYYGAERVKPGGIPKMCVILVYVERWWNATPCTHARERIVWFTY